MYASPPGDSSDTPASPVVQPVDVGLRQRCVVPDFRFIDGFQILEIEDRVAAAEREAQCGDPCRSRDGHWTPLFSDTSMPTAKVRMRGYARMLFISGSNPQSPI